MATLEKIDKFDANKNNGHSTRNIWVNFSWLMELTMLRKKNCVIVCYWSCDVQSTQKFVSSDETRWKKLRWIGRNIVSTLQSAAIWNNTVIQVSQLFLEPRLISGDLCIWTPFIGRILQIWTDTRSNATWPHRLWYQWWHYLTTYAGRTRTDI